MTSENNRAGMTRRKFMEMMGVTAGGVAGLSTMPPSIRRALAIEPNNATGTIRDVEHVVIMMQENRSFDHYFGTYNGVRGFTDPRPVISPRTGKDVFHQPINDSLSYLSGKRCGVPLGATEVLPYPVDYDKTGEGLRGTDHGAGSGQVLWSNGLWDNWIPAKADVLTMSYLRYKDISYHRYLANAFTICDHNFISVHADTIPNRQFLVSAAAANPALDVPSVKWPDYDKTPGMATRKVSDWTTYPERIEKFNNAQTDPAKKITWRTYQGGTGKPGEPTDCYQENNLAYFAAYCNQPEPGCYWVEGICYKDGRPFTVANPDALPNLVKYGVTNYTINQMKQDVLQDKLPNISWVVAPYKNCEHPTATVTDGAYYINEVLSALVANPAVWRKTVFIINYDENDGLFDHIVAPMPTDTADPGKMSPSLLHGIVRERYNKTPTAKDPWGDKFMGFGPRVPMLVVSPWSRGGWVCSEIFDHTSTLRFLETRFGLESNEVGPANPFYESNLTPWRRAMTGDLSSALDFAHNDGSFTHYDKGPFRARPTIFASAPPDVPASNVLPKAENPVVNYGADNTSNADFTRKARPVPHAFHVNCHYDETLKQLIVNFDNRDRGGAYFYAYDYVNTTDKPRRYSVIKGEPLQDQWNVVGTGYDLAIHGANGFMRRFKGLPATLATANPEVEIMYQASGDVTLKLINRGVEDCMLKITSYYDKIDAADGLPKIVIQTLKGAECTFEFVELKTKSGWYDISVELLNKANEPDRKYLRRFAGHVETGAPSITDPFLTYNNVETA